HHLALSRTKQAAQNHPVDLTRCNTARDASLSVQRATSNSRPGTGRTSPILEKPGPDVHMTRAICQARRPRTPRARHIALSLTPLRRSQSVCIDLNRRQPISAEGDHSVIESLPTVHDTRQVRVLVVKEVEIVTDQLHLVKRVIDRHGFGGMVLLADHTA